MGSERLLKMRQLAKSETERADSEAERADAAQKQLDTEVEARKALEEELALLRAQLGQSKT